MVDSWRGVASPECQPRAIRMVALDITLWRNLPLWHHEFLTFIPVAGESRKESGTISMWSAFLAAFCVGLLASRTYGSVARGCDGGIWHIFFRFVFHPQRNGNEPWQDGPVRCGF